MVTTSEIVWLGVAFLVGTMVFIPLWVTYHLFVRPFLYRCYDYVLLLLSVRNIRKTGGLGGPR